MKKSGLLLLALLFLVACSYNYINEIGKAVSLEPRYDKEIYKYPSFVDGCDRFRLIFNEKLSKYPQLNVFDITMIYAMAYQESLCQTKDELFARFQENNDSRETWKGGIMQVDGCWRGNLRCSSIREEIESGIQQLDFSYSKINSEINRYQLNLSTKEKIRLLLISYNRGFFVADTALMLYAEKLASGNFFLSPLTKKSGQKLYVLINCPEKDRCTDDGTYIEVENLELFQEDFDKSILIACRSKFGLMEDEQGDYCIGEGYGLNYIKDTLEVYNKIVNYSHITSKKEKEFYINEINFSGYDWLVKKSFKKTGPGPNLFYYDQSSVFIDGEKYLHLRIINHSNKWYSSEVVLPEHLGYGKYIFHIMGDLTKINKNVVLGLFTYDLTMLPGYHHREIDFEVSRWGDGTGRNAQFAIQGAAIFEPVNTFDLEHQEDLIFSFNWQPGLVEFEVRTDPEGHLVEKWNYSGVQVPEPAEENVRMNLWIYRTSKDMEETEVIIKSFEFRNHKN